MGGRRVMVTGHSQAGYMAEVLATSCGISGVGFCAPGSGWHQGSKGGEKSGFRNVNFEHDRLGNVLAGVFEHAQWSVYVQDPGRETHDIATMVKCMKARKRWTNRNVVAN